MFTVYTLKTQRAASLSAKHSCRQLTQAYGCMFIENNPNSLCCSLSKYRMHIFALVNCSLPLVFTLALLFLSSWHHGLVTNRPRTTMRIKKREKKEWKQMWSLAALENCLHPSFFLISVYFISEYNCCSVCMLACVLYTSPSMAGSDELNLLTVMTRCEVRAEFIFPLFYPK